MVKPAARVAVGVKWWASPAKCARAVRDLPLGRAGSWRQRVQGRKIAVGVLGDELLPVVEIVSTPRVSRLPFQYAPGGPGIVRRAFRRLSRRPALGGGRAPGARVPPREPCRFYRRWPGTAGCGTQHASRLTDARSCRTPPGRPGWTSTDWY